MTEKISIIMACKDHKAYTINAIRRLLRNTEHEFELIIADDSIQLIGMSIGELVKDIDCKVLYPARPRAGAGQARNDCLRNCKNEYVIDVDNDVMVTPGWDIALVEKLTKEPDIGLLLPMSNDLYFFDPRLFKLPNGEDMDLLEICNKFKFLRHQNYAAIENNPNDLGHQILEDIINKSYLSGLDGFTKMYLAGIEKEDIHMMNTWSSWATRLSIMKDVGGYDERYIKAGYEDLDLARRLNMLGYRTIVTFESYVHHCMGTTRPFIPGAIEAETRNSEYYRTKFSNSDLNPRESWVK